MSTRNILAAAVGAFVALGCTTLASVQAQQPVPGDKNPGQAQAPAGPPAPMAVVGSATRFKARLLDVVDGTMHFEAAEGRPPRLITLAPEQIKALGTLKGRSFDVTAVERPSPAGFTSVIVLRDERGLYAIAERVTEVPLLAPSDREGVLVEAVTTGPRVFVYETACKTVYYVPAKFTVNGQSYVVKAYETRDIQIDKASYQLSIGDSTLTVLKDCPHIEEGSRVTVDYSVVRKQ